MTAAPTPLPELIDARGIQTEIGVKRTVAERIMGIIPLREGTPAPCGSHGRQMFLRSAHDGV